MDKTTPGCHRPGRQRPGFSMIAEFDLRLLRLDAARRGKWNIGFFFAGLMFWISAAYAGINFDLNVARTFWLVGSFLIFPLAVASSYLVRAEPFTRGNVLGELVGYTHMSVITLTFPLIIWAYLYKPELMLLMMAILYCVDFYVMTWAFNTPLFGIHAAARTIAASVIWFAMPDWRFSVLPATIAAFYLATIVLSFILRAQWLTVHRSAPWPPR